MEEVEGEEAWNGKGNGNGSDADRTTTVTPAAVPTNGSSTHASDTPNPSHSTNPLLRNAGLSSFRPAGASSGISRALLGGRPSLGEMVAASDAAPHSSSHSRKRRAETEADGGGADETQRRKVDSGAASPASYFPPSSLGVEHDNGDDDDDFFMALMDPGSKRDAQRQFIPTLFRPVTDSPTLDGEDADATNDAAGTGSSLLTGEDGSRFSALSFPAPPLDWNLHSKMRITSNVSFDWIKENDVQCECEASRAFCSLGAKDICDCLSSSRLREFYHSLLYCQFPAHPFSKTNPLTSAIQIALNKPHDARTQQDTNSINFLAHTWIQWLDRIMQTLALTLLMLMYVAA